MRRALWARKHITLRLAAKKALTEPWLCKGLGIMGRKGTKSRAPALAGKAQWSKERNGRRNFDISYFFRIFVCKFMKYRKMQNLTSFQIVAEIGTRYKQFRRAAGITQMAVHVKTGIAVSTLSLFENGKGQGLSFENLVSLLKVIGLEDGLLYLVPDIPDINLERSWKLNRKK